MNRLNRGTATSLLKSGNNRNTDSYNNYDDDVEEQLYERQALIDDDELNHESAFEFRNRSNHKSDFRGTGYELKNVSSSRTSYINSEPLVSDFTYYDIKPGDSLQNICLRYACPVNQVKRLNNLMNDQEFYGLRKIKLPLGKLGLLEEVLKSQQEQEQQQTQFGHHQQRQISSSSNNNKSVNDIVNEFQLQSSSRSSSPAPKVTKNVNSIPGSALSVSTRSYNNPQFKPLLSPGYSSDKINELNNRTNSYNNFNDDKSDVSHLRNGSSNSKASHQHSHSFSSLKDFSTNNNNNNDININIDPLNQQHYVDTRQLFNQKTFIRSDLDYQYDENVDTDDILMIGHDNIVEKVFEDLDYHVERVKAVTETYDQRAAELVNRMGTNDLTSPYLEVTNRNRLFYCDDNFGLSYVKLLILIIIICLLGPIIFFNLSTSNHHNHQATIPSNSPEIKRQSFSEIQDSHQL